MGRLAGKRALITGAAQGIGRATAELFAAEDAWVLATDVNAALLKDMAKEEGLESEVLDVTDAAAITRMGERLGAIDILFNCAGYAHHGAILDCPENEWDRTIATNVRSMYLMIRTFLPSMIAAGGGSIINMSSVVSSVKGVPNRCAYAASKAAVIGLTKAVAADYIGQRIRCNALCPGTVDTPSLSRRIADASDPDVAKRAFIARQPMGRIGRAEEIAGAALYLASDESRFMTGTIMIIDGGMSL